MWVTTVKYLSGHRKHRYELVYEPKTQPNTTFIDKKLATTVIRDCGTTAAHKTSTFRTRLGFKQYDVILTKKQSLVICKFEEKSLQTQDEVFSYRSDLYFHDYKLEIKIDENGHSSKSIDYKIKNKKIEKELSCEFVIIDPDKEDFDIFKAISKILSQLTKY